jgi:hypothetical protein
MLRLVLKLTSIFCLGVFTLLFAERTARADVVCYVCVTPVGGVGKTVCTQVPCDSCGRPSIPKSI